MVQEHIQNTFPEVFIIESLNFDDEDEKKFEGKILYDMLRLCGKDPKYYYFRTKDELVHLALKFRESNYRFLHVSCHGAETSIETTLDKVTYIEFAEIFEGLLRNRRLFMSACSAGNELFSEILFGRNRGMYSIAAPIDKIEFRKAIGMWSAFYSSLFSTNSSYVKNDSIINCLSKLTELFNERFILSWHDSVNKKITNKTFNTKAPTKFKIAKTKSTTPPLI